MEVGEQQPAGRAAGVPTKGTSGPSQTGIADWAIWHWEAATVTEGTRLLKHLIRQPPYWELSHSVKELFFLWEKSHCFPSLTSSWLKKPDLVVLSHCPFLDKILLCEGTPRKAGPTLSSFSWESREDQRWQLQWIGAWDEKNNIIISLGQDLVSQLLPFRSHRYGPLACATLSFFFCGVTILQTKQLTTSQDMLWIFPQTGVSARLPKAFQTSQLWKGAHSNQ